MAEPIPAASIRAARPDDGPVLQQIEGLAGERFRDVGLDAVADDDPLALDVLTSYAVAGRAWVAVDANDRPLAYVLIDVVDGAAHIEQVSVLPEHQGRGVGRALVEVVREWAVAAGLVAITLTTFRDVPWNAPLYAHLGFEIVPEDSLGPGLRAIRDAESAHGLDPATRVCMRLRTAGGTP